MAGQVPPPVLLAVIPCEYLHCDPASQKFTAVGIMNYCVVPGFPHQLRRGMGVYAAVTGVRYPTTIALQLVTPEGDELDAFGVRLQVVDPLTVHELGGSIGAIFETPGVYRLRATADGDMLGEWRIRVGTAPESNHA